MSNLARIKRTEGQKRVEFQMSLLLFDVSLSISELCLLQDIQLWTKAPQLVKYIEIRVFYLEILTKSRSQ